MARNAGVTYLAKADGRLVCHCSCEQGLIMNPTLVQLDCPWCGCGWLFCCMTCHKAFSFAKVVTVDVPLDELARRDLAGAGVEPSKKAVAGWVALMKELTTGLEVGTEYAYMDGFFLPTEEAGLEFDGIHRSHKFDRAPHVDALSDPGVVERVLANPDYWGLFADRDDE